MNTEPLVDKCIHCRDYHRRDYECSQKRLFDLSLGGSQAWVLFTILMERHDARIVQDTTLINYYRDRAEKAEKNAFKLSQENNKLQEKLAKPKDK